MSWRKTPYSASQDACSAGFVPFRKVSSVPAETPRKPYPAKVEIEEVEEPYGAHPHGRREKAGQDVRRVVDPEVHAREADEEDEDETAQHYRPAPETSQAPGGEQGQGAVEADGHGSVAAREGVRGLHVPGLEEVRAGALEDVLEYGGQDYAPERGDHKQGGGDPPPLMVEGVRCQDEQREDHPIVAQKGDEAQHPIEPVGRVPVDP